MARTFRLTPGPNFTRNLAAEFARMAFKANFSHDGAPVIANGTTAGRLRTTASVTGRIAGVNVTKASTDNFWDLSAETDTTEAAAAVVGPPAVAETFDQYRAYWLYIDAAGAASFAASPNASTEAAAIAALPMPVETKAVWGVFVAGPACDFNAAGGLAAQGTISQGIPTGAPIGGTVVWAAPARLDYIKA